MSKRAAATVTHYRDGRVEVINHFTGEKDTLEPGEEIKLITTGGCLLPILFMFVIILLSYNG